MAKIKIHLEKHETPELVDEMLIKALALHTNGDVHEGEKYGDVAIQNVVDYLSSLWENEWKELSEEIAEALRSEYEKDYLGD